MTYITTDDVGKRGHSGPVFNFDIKIKDLNPLSDMDGVL